MTKQMEPRGQSPWYLHKIPSYAKASEGYPQMATSAVATYFIFGQFFTHSSTGKARGFLRRRIRIRNMLISLATLLLLSSFVWAQGPGHNYHNGRHHNEDWPDSLTVVSVSGTVVVDTLMMNPWYYLDTNNDDSSDYRLGFGPWWYEPASGAVRPNTGNIVNIIGGLNDSMIPAMLVVFEINGLVWRDSTGAPPWSGGWVHHDASDTTWIYCPTDSMDHLGFPPQSMLGMMWPDSLYCQFEEMDPDSIPGMTDSTMFEGYSCNFNTEMGGHMGSGMGMMNFNRSLHFQFHYDDQMNGMDLDEGTIQLFYLDETDNWQEVTTAIIDTDANTVIVDDINVARYYALKAFPTTVSIDNEVDAFSLLPQSIALESIYPNPFNPQATIRYDVARAGNVQAQIFDLQGKLVRDLFSGRQNQGKHTINWDAKNNLGQSVASGTYLIKVSSGNSSAIRMITLVR
ncbi:MAG: T9SS type A sorting domain-containing protein [Candidatus Marinimicrobia bacterium]|nr:T9SS type A sorting domain-containing protein [Candidatus Neomarinimicrobiota bacterium]